MSEYKEISKCKVIIKCDFCGKEFERYKTRMRKTFNFCSMKCAMDFSNKEKNNDPSNLMIFKNQSEHAKWHAEHKKKGGD